MSEPLGGGGGGASHRASLAGYAELMRQMSSGGNIEKWDYPLNEWEQAEKDNFVIWVFTPASDF